MYIKKVKLVFIRTLFYISALLFSEVISAAEFSQVRPSNEEFMQLPETNWLKNGGDFYNRNFSQLDQINTQMWVT